MKEELNVEFRRIKISILVIGKSLVHKLKSELLLDVGSRNYQVSYIDGVLHRLSQRILLLICLIFKQMITLSKKIKASDNQEHCLRN